MEIYACKDEPDRLIGSEALRFVFIDLSHVTPIFDTELANEIRRRLVAALEAFHKKCGGKKWVRLFWNREFIARCQPGLRPDSAVSECVSEVLAGTASKNGFHE
jgi:hypothetical protein